MKSSAFLTTNSTICCIFPLPDSMAGEWLVYGFSCESKRKLTGEKGLSESKVMSTSRQTTTERRNIPAQVCSRASFFHSSGM